MFFLAGGIAVIICTAVEYLFFCKSKKVLSLIGIALKHCAVDISVALTILLKVLKYGHFLYTASYGTASFVKFGLITLAVGAVLLLFTAFYRQFITFELEEKQPKKSKAAKRAKEISIISVIFVFLGCVFYFGTEWSRASFGEVTAEQLIINMMAPGGAEAGVYLSVIEGPLVYTIAITSLFALFVFLPFRIIYASHGNKKVIISVAAKRIIALILSLVMMVSAGTYAVIKFDLRQLYYSNFKVSTIFEDEYADPKTTKLTFPEQKRNIIHIYVESLENSFLSKDLGGNIDVNLMPELTELAEEGYVFSDTDRKFGGPQEILGTQWSIASMVNQTSGVPMKMPNASNQYGSEGDFLPGAWTTMEILDEQGYEQTVMFGSDGNFGNLKYYYLNHGKTTVFDLGYVRRNGLLPEHYKVWWGFEDDKLYEFAKEEITRMYETGKPFNFMMETADTHRPGGYLSENAPRPYKSHYANAIAYSTEQVVEFVRWIQQQPFYENTTIIIIGDHLSMDTVFFEEYDFSKSYDRTQFNLIINPAPDIDVSNDEIFHNRLWCNFDMFPTILASAGVKIEGERLGMGTNLFSGKETLTEKYGVKGLNRELQMKSELFNNQILKKPNTETEK